MAYITQSNIDALIPPAFVIQALDDNGDGTADAGVWDKVEAAAAEEIDAALARRYSVPFASPPPGVRQAARVLVCEALYMRRGYHGEQNPWSERAKSVRAELVEIGNGEAALSVDDRPVEDAIGVESEPSKTYSSSGRLMI